jgi:hypothetical protein
MTDLLYKEEVYAIVGAAMEVYNDLGPRFLENVYQEAMEIKAMDRLTLREESQLINYLKATGMKVGVLINFGHYPSLEWKRLVFTKEPPSRPATRSLREDSSNDQAKIRED